MFLFTKSYTYDKAARLTDASVFANTYIYSYGAPTACTGTFNANANKNSNRTSQTINTATTTYCYDKADRLISSTNTRFAAPAYDTHGNMSGSGTSTKLEYDSSDRSVYTSESGIGGTSNVWRDALDRLTNNDDAAGYYGYTDTNDSPDYIYSTTATIIESYIHLEGGTLAVVGPGTTKKYSFSNIHGDTFATSNTSGATTGSYSFQPYGLSVGAQPFNINGSTNFGYLGQHSKITSGGTSQFIQMGARLYLPTLGRFAQVDPVEGGTANNYVYPGDPVNEMDLTGEVGQYISAPTAIEGFNCLTNNGFGGCVKQDINVLLWIAPIPSLKGVQAAKGVRFVVRNDRADHYFRNVFNSRDKIWSRHIQLNVYKRGISNSSYNFRIPYGPAYKLKYGKGGWRWW